MFAFLHDPNQVIIAALVVIAACTALVFLMAWFSDRSRR